MCLLLYGGEGVVAVWNICGYIPSTRKANLDFLSAKARGVSKATGKEWTIACNPYIQVVLKKREPLVYLDYKTVCQTIKPKSLCPVQVVAGAITALSKPY